MALLSEVSEQMKFNVPCLVLKIVLFCVYFGVPSWLSESTTNTNGVNYDFRPGLWRICGTIKNYDVCFAWRDDDVKTWKKRSVFRPTDMLLGCALVSLLGVLENVLAALRTNNKVTVVASFICSFVSGTFMLLGSVLLGLSLKDDSFYSSNAHLTWGFAFNIIASIFTLAGGVGLVFEIIYARTPENRPTELTPP